jgi:hypothetical protein
LIEFLSTGPYSSLWPIITAGLCGLLVMTSWLFSDEPLYQLYGQPFHWVGLGLTIIPIVGLLATANELVGIITLAMVGSIYIMNGLQRGWIYQVYLGTAAFIGVIWLLLTMGEIEAVQLYILPVGVWLVVLAWIERYRGQIETYWLLTIIGLSLLLGSAFVQSWTSAGYAALLLLESLMALVIGFGIRSRSYILIGLVSLILNGLVQFLPAFAEFPRFIQVGFIGIILLGGGLIALFLREEIIGIGRRARLHWQGWGV